MNLKNIDNLSLNSPDFFDKVKTNHISFSRFTEEEKSFYLAGLIEGDGHIARDQLRISFHRKDRIAAENIIYGLGYGTITDQKKEQCSVLTFCGESLEKVIHLMTLNSHWLSGFMDSDGHLGIQIRKQIDTATFNVSLIINFVQKESFLLELIVALFKTHKIHRKPLKDGRLSYGVTFTSKKTL